MSIPSENFKELTIKIKDRPSDCKLYFDDQPDTSTLLGKVQSVVIKAEIGAQSNAVIETICTEAEAKILLESAHINVKILDKEAYGFGFSSRLTGEKNTYPKNSYAYFLFNEGLKDSLEAIEVKEVGSSLVKLSDIIPLDPIEEDEII